MMPPLPAARSLFPAAALIALAVGTLAALSREAPAEVIAATAETEELGEDSLDPGLWEKKYPLQCEGFRRTAETGRTKHGGSAGHSKLDRDPRLKQLYAGNPFALDYRESRGHAHMLADQDASKRVTETKQPGACLHCHASALPAWRRAGDGDVMRGFERVCAMPLADARKLVTHPASCVDCHEPKSMRLRVTRPAFVNAVRDLARSDDPLPHLRSIEVWREGPRDRDYDPNALASRHELRTFVCAQCHAEYYFRGSGKLLAYPWANGLKPERIEQYYDEIDFADWKHPKTGAALLKAQHPEFETWSQGVHARSGVGCVDCHMPTRQAGEVTFTDHQARSPLLAGMQVCQQCHREPANAIRGRVEAIQDRTRALLDRAEDEVLRTADAIAAARTKGVPEEELAAACRLHRKAQWRLDFVAAENSTGFHASEHTTRLLTEAITLARRGRIQPPKP